MHDFLRAIGFKSIRTKKQLKLLIDWVLERPDSLSIVSKDSESNLAQASREINGNAGISVVGEIDERGNIIPEYYFPYISTSQISSDAPLSYEKQSDKDGFIAMCEDFKLGMALIFFVKNVTEVMKQEEDYFLEAGFTKAALGALAKDGRVLLPVQESEKVLDRNIASNERKAKLMEEAHAGDAQAMEKLTEQEMLRYQHVMKEIHESDVYTIVNSFFMPYGMESDQYYFLGRILAKQLFENEITKEHFYRLLVEANGIPLCVVINETDLEGVPEVGYRIKCHAWLMGDLKR